MNYPAPHKVYIVQRKTAYYGRRARVVAVLPDRAAAENALLRADSALWPTLRHLFWDDPHTLTGPVARRHDERHRYPDGATEHPDQHEHDGEHPRCRLAQR